VQRTVRCVPAARAPKRRTWRSEARNAPEVLKACVDLGKRIRAIRLRKGLTLEQAAPLARVDWKHLQVIEQGKTNTTVASLVGIAAALEVPLAKLFEEG
jgi:DNA-binding XRE family transcriptional regulator